ncbi:flavin-containing monooxygenase [Nocardia noduli]|uniref:flavin-containing monooxygenase n=1 Tax=Nocardia noduli TaxID=2815722 RepID=UPI001C216CCB|nr:NAD(P)/FAD-dependent oxidoreductase [Nocardia noduli]
MSDIQRCDAVVIGAGFAGMYALHRLRDDLGLRARVFERGTDVGGTWYWNRYPGARCDVVSLFYSYSFSDELEKEWEWTELYPAQAEILAYANHVADRFDLRKDITFETSVESADYDEDSQEWVITTDRGERVAARFLITAAGCLSASRVPTFPGIDTFEGETYHTGRWPHEGVDFSGKKVAVIGTGSSGIQAIPQIAQQADHLTVFQRTPAFSLPARNRPLTAEEIADFKANFRERRAAARVAPSGVPGTPPVGSAFSVTDQQREELLTDRWNLGGVEFLRVFNDTSINLEANEFSAEYVRDRIRDLIEDPATAEKLVPHGYPIGAKRICLDTDYYVTYNRDNVDLVSVRETPIEEVTPAGLRVGGTEYEFDVIVFATGYDAMTGPLNAIDIRGIDGQLLRDKWAAGPRTYLGIATANFPNLFMLTAPGSPSVLANMIISIEQHVDWVADLLVYLREHGYTRVEAVVDEEDKWVEHVNEVASHTLFPQGNSWYSGANIPGKARVFMPYVAGAGTYRKICDEVAADDYRGFTLSAATHETDSRSSVVGS